MDIKNLKELIKGWDSERLSKAYIKWIIRSQAEENEVKVDKYNEQINAVLAEWSNRPNLGKKGSDRPELGLLKTMGYRVGVEGLHTKARRRILKDVIRGPLPLVGNVSYMNEWGSDSSLQRLYKLENCLSGFMNGGQHSNHFQALQDWEEDLDWLRSKNYENH